LKLANADRVLVARELFLLPTQGYVRDAVCVPRRLACWQWQHRFGVRTVIPPILWF